MSRFHNSAEAEELCVLTHQVWAWLSLVSAAMGLAAFGWHWWGAEQHKQARARLKAAAAASGSSAEAE